MSSRMPCKHEKWASQRNRANVRDSGPLVMGPTPPCPWCSRDAGQRLLLALAKDMARDKALEEAASLFEHEDPAKDVQRRIRAPKSDGGLS